MSEGRGDVAYVVSRWGEPTQTFVRREVQAVLDAGGTVRVLSLKRPHATSLDVAVVHLGPLRVLRGALATMLRHPRSAFGALRTVIARSAPRNVVPQIGACAIGLAWAANDATAADLVQVHFGWVAATAAWAESSVSKRPYAVVLHAFELHSARRIDRFTSTPLRDATRVSTISRRDAALVHERWGLAAEVHRMGVSDDWFESAANGERDPWLIVSVGSLLPKKGHDVLIEAVAQADPRWRLIIVGEGRERAALTALARRLDIADRVELAGARSEEDVRALVASARAFALASVVAADGDRDGIPVALMEAMACGTPVVTTRTGAIEELADGCAVLVDPGDVESMARAIDSLRDADRLFDAAERGRARVSSEFRARTGGERVLALARRQAG